MPIYEYNVVPAPKKGLKGKGIKTTEARFANAMMSVMNELALEGWEYLRSDALPLEERSGFRSRSSSVQNVLVFRRDLTVAAALAHQAPPAAAPVTQPVSPQVQHTAPALGAATDAREVVAPRRFSAD